MTQLQNRITSPSWWQLINWIANSPGFRDKSSRKYGDIFTMRLGSIGSCVIIGNPKAIQEIFNQDSKFDVGCGNALAEPLVGQNFLILLDGDRHRPFVARTAMQKIRLNTIACSCSRVPLIKSLVSISLRKYGKCYDSRVAREG